MKVVSLFSGIGGFEEGIKRTSIPYEVVLASEIVLSSISLRL